MVKSGRTEAGARAASSHTGSLAGADLATDALFRQTGVIRAKTIDEMMALILGFSRCELPAGDRVAVLTNAGGPGILATDALIGHGMKLAEISNGTREKLKVGLPAEASVSNPIDMIAGADAESFGRCLRILLEAPEVDLAIVAFVPPIMVNPMDVVRAVTEARRGSPKPVFMVLMAEEEYYARIPAEIPDSPPVYRYPETAAYAASEMASYARSRNRDLGRIPELDRDLETARRILKEESTPGEYLDADAVFRLLAAYRFPLARWKQVHSVEEALVAAEEIGYPTVLKIAGRKVVHKSDVGGVILGIRNALEMEGAGGKLTRAMRNLGLDPAHEGFLVQEMARAEREVILGMSRDPVLGPVLLFGLGGKYVEVFQDVSLRVHPITDVDARDMVSSIRGYPLLAGVRGEAGVAMPVAHEALLRLSAMVTDFDSIAEIDLNPFLLAPDPTGCKIVDARIRVRG
jgi:acetyltransferase